MVIMKTDIIKIANEIFSRPVSVLNYVIMKKPGKLEAFMSSSQLIKITVEENGRSKTVTCFMKTMPRENDFQQLYIINTKAFIKETFFYNKLAKDMMKFSVEKAFPACYLAVENEVLVLEFLEGYWIKNINELFNLEEMKAAIKALAVFHSSSIIFESKYNVKLDNIAEDYLMEHFFKREDGHFGYKHFLTGVRAFKAIIEKYFDLDEETKKFVHQVYDSIPESLVASTKHRNVICHGDAYGNNIMFTRIGELKACIVDFQLIRFSPPGHDLTLMIHSNFSEKEYHEHYSSLVQYYYDCVQLNLESFGLDVSIEFPYDNFKESMEETKLAALAVSSLYQHYVTLPEKQLDPIMSDSNLLKHFLLEDRNDIVMTAFESSPTYKERVYTAINSFITECKEKMNRQ